MTGIELVQTYFPDTNEDTAGYILWNQTSFPFGDREYIEGCLKTLKTTLDAGGTPCFGCNEPAITIGKVFDLCERCNTND